MVRIISVPYPHPHPFLRIWYALSQIRRIRMRIRIIVNRISDEYGNEYGIDNIRRIWIIRYFLRIIRCYQIGLSDKFGPIDKPNDPIRSLIRITTYKYHITLNLIAPPYDCTHKMYVQAQKIDLRTRTVQAHLHSI